MDGRTAPGARRLAVAALVAASLVIGLAAPAAAAPDTYVVGDSLTHQTYESDGWYVDAANRRALYGSVRRVVSTLRNHRGAAVIVALGSNDVGGRSRTMARNLATVLDAAEGAAGRAGRHCLLVTTVKVAGVSPVYANGQWRRWATRWNAAVWRSGAYVADWRPEAEAHPEWFLSDGLHLKPAGERAYDAFLRSAVAASCVPPDA